MNKIRSFFAKRLFKDFSGLLTRSRTMSRYFVNKKEDNQTANDSQKLSETELKPNLFKLISSIENHFKPTEKNGTDGVYLGTAGISYMFYHLSKLPSLQQKKSEFLNKAFEYLKPALTVAQYTRGNKKDEPAFILGNSGIYAVAAVIFHAMGDDVQSHNYQLLFHNAANVCKNPHFLKCGSDELFVGRAGYIMGALWMAKETSTPLQAQNIVELCKVIVNSGRDYAHRHNSPCPLMYAYYDVEYLGAAHGLCSILQALLSVPNYIDSYPTDANDIKQSVDYLLSLQTKDGNFPAATDEIGYEPKLVHWCHGAPGVIYLMAKAYLVFKEKKYLDSCKLMGDLIWQKGLLKKGPSLCHGIAGNAYAFLLLYRLTDDPRYFYRAIEFYEFLDSEQFKNEARIPDHPYSLFEGIAGTCCFIGDLTCPKQACFPFFDVF